MEERTDTLRRELIELRKKLARTEAQCRKSTEANKRLAQGLDIVEEALCIMDSKGRLLFMNKAGYSLTETTPEQQEGKIFNTSYAPWARKVLIEEALPYATNTGKWEGSLALLGRRTDSPPITIFQRIVACPNERGEMFYCCRFTPTPSSESQSKYYQELVDRLPLAMGIWKREQPAEPKQNSDRTSISVFEQNGAQDLFRLAAANDRAAKLLGVPMGIGESLGDALAVNIATEERVHVASFFSDTLRSGNTLSVDRFRILFPSSSSMAPKHTDKRDRSPLSSSEVSIRAFPLGKNYVAVCLEPTCGTESLRVGPLLEDQRNPTTHKKKAENEMEKDTPSHPLVRALSSTSFSLCLATRREPESKRSSPNGEKACWTFDYVSPGLAHVLGCSSEDIWGKDVFSLCIQDDAAEDSLRTFHAAMSEGRECAIAVVLSSSSSSSSSPIKCRLSASPLAGGSQYLLFYSQFKPVDTSPGSASHILSYTEDEDVFCRIFESLSVGMILWRMELSSKQQQQQQSTQAAQSRRHRFRLLAANKKARNLNLSGEQTIGRYLDELTPELETGLIEAYLEALRSGQPRPLGLVPLYHEGYKPCLLASTAFPISSTLLAIIFDEAPPSPSLTISNITTATSVTSAWHAAPSQVTATKREHGGARGADSTAGSLPSGGIPLPVPVSRKRKNDHKIDTFDNECSRREALSQPSSSDNASYPGGYDSNRRTNDNASHHPFVRVPTPHKKQRSEEPSSHPFGVLPSASSLLQHPPSSYPPTLPVNGHHAPTGEGDPWFRMAPVPCAVLTGEEGGRILRANEAFGELVGRPAETLVDLPFSSISPDRQSQSTPEPSGHSLLGRMASGEGPAMHHREAVYRRRCGQGVECIESMWALPGGRVGLLVQPIAALRERFPSALGDRIFQRCFAVVPFGAGLLGKEGRLLETNPAFASLLGYSEGSLNGQSFHSFIHPEDVETILSLPYRMVHSGVPSTQLIVRCRCRDNATLFCLMCLSLINDASTGSTTHLLCILQPLSALEKIFQAL